MKYNHVIQAIEVSKFNKDMIDKSIKKFQEKKMTKNITALKTLKQKTVFEKVFISSQDQSYILKSFKEFNITLPAQNEFCHEGQLLG